MSRSRMLSSIAAASLGIALLGACSAESLTERAIESGLEQALEGNGDVDLDFDSDGSGGINITTDEGELSIDVDGEDASIVFDTEDGAGSVNFDQDAGTVNVTTEDGTASIATNVEAPDGWPAIIGIPATAPPGSTSYNVIEIDGTTFAISASFEYATGDPFGADVVARLQADGWQGEPAPSNDGGLSALLRKDGESIQILADPNYAQITFTLPLGE